MSWRKPTSWLLLAAVPVTFAAHPLSGFGLSKPTVAELAAEDDGIHLAEKPRYKAFREQGRLEQLADMHRSSPGMAANCYLAVAAATFCWPFLRAKAGVGCSPSPTRSALVCAARVSAVVAAVVASDLALWLYRANHFGPHDIWLLRCGAGLDMKNWDRLAILESPAGAGIRHNPLVPGHANEHEGPCYHMPAMMARPTSREEVLHRRTAQWLMPSAIVLLALAGSAPLAPFCLLPVVVWKQAFHVLAPTFNQQVARVAGVDTLGPSRDVLKLTGSEEEAWAVYRKARTSVADSEKARFLSILRKDP